MPFKKHLVLTLTLLLVIYGCAPIVRLHPDFVSKVGQIKTVAVLPLDVKVYKLTAGGIREEMDEWSNTASANIKNALRNILSQRLGWQMKLVEKSELASHSQLWDDTSALYRAVSNSIILHTFVPEHTFASKIKNFDYSLGAEVSALLAGIDADGYLFIYSRDYVSTAGRKALMALNIIIAAAAGVAATPSVGTTSMSAALVERNSGDILWFDFSPPQGGYSLQDANSAASLTQKVFRNLRR